MPIEAIGDTELTPSEFKVLVALYSFRDKNADTTFPKLSSLAARAGFKDSTQVSKITTRLESKGWLTKKQKMGFHGPKKYKLSIPARLTQQVQTAQLGRIIQLGKPGTADSPNLEELSNLDEPAITNLDKTTNSQLGQNYQGYKNRPVRTDQIEQTSFPVAAATAAGAAFPAVDNFSLVDLAQIYNNPDSESEAVSHGVPMLTRSGVEFQKARNFFAMVIKKHGPGAVLDAVITCLIEQPIEPKSYLQAVLAKQGAPIPHDWTPPAPCLSDLAEMGIPENIYQPARDAFVIWFRDHGIRHPNFPGLFVRWCERDWERAEGNRQVYLQRLNASAGFKQEFREPA